MAFDLVINSRAGTVAAPAGCGKTQLIANALSVPTTKPCLVLTHTTAGVAALKKRLKGVPPSNYRVATIAGWALNIANMFPGVTGYAPAPNSPPNYNALQQAIANLCLRGDLQDIFVASYSRLFVDEYQDCTHSQHQIVCGLARCLPTVVFGDPMQSIFDFSGPLPDWENTILESFPLIAELDTPWRWNNAGSPELGSWILNARQQLLEGNNLDLTSCPNHVTWCPLGKNARENLQNQINAQYRVRQNMLLNEKLLVIGDSINVNSRHEFARSANGLEVVEPVDLKDIVSAARSFGRLQGENLLEGVLDVASNMITGVDRAALFGRAKTIVGGRNRTAPSPIEHVATTVIKEGTPSSILELLKVLEEKEGVKLYRRDALYALKDALELTVSDPSKSIHDSAAIIREQRRHRGDKRIPSRAIGSTLLLKGLEADHVIILDADRMNARHLYVALSRGAKSVTVFSTGPMVG